MNKVPVADTIIYAYTFLFGHIAVIVRVAWLPAILNGIVDYGATMMQPAQMTPGDPAQAGQSLLISLGSAVLTLAISSIVAVAVTREGLGLGTGTAPFYFRFGREEWRMFLAYLRYTGAAIALAALASVVSIVALLLARVPLGGNQAPPVTLASGVAALVSVAAIVYALIALLRMGFFLPATIVAERKGGLRRSDALSSGNVLRILAIGLAVILPVFLLAGTGGLAILGRENLMHLPQAAQLAPQRFIAWQAFGAILFVLVSGLTYSAQAYAYRALVPAGEEPLPEA